MVHQQNVHIDKWYQSALPDTSGPLMLFLIQMCNYTDGLLVILWDASLNVFECFEIVSYEHLRLL